MLSFHSRPSLRSVLFPSSIPNKIFCALVTTAIRATRLANLIILEFIFLVTGGVHKFRFSVHAEENISFDVHLYHMEIA